MTIGSVIRIPVNDTNPPKIKKLIIVGDTGGKLATIFINTNIHINNLAPELQGLHLPINPDSCPFLEHDSYADCSDLRERDKSEINRILQKDPGRKEGSIPAVQLTAIIDCIKKAKTIAPILKKKFGLGY